MFREIDNKGLINLIEELYGFQNDLGHPSGRTPTEDNIYKLTQILALALNIIRLSLSDAE